ncbi:MAG: prepilin-type N-terminal cleavage/methylation domain-containing protein [Planctomycetota bacterium]|jgi:prepilin-type N-terminal cleavage/methylation domain-containing protein
MNKWKCADDRGLSRKGVSRQRGGSNGTAGFTLIELMIAIMLIMVGLAGYLQSIIQSTATAEDSRRMAIATQRGRVIMESIKGATFSDVFATFNGDGADDPEGADTAVGENFAATGLEAAANDADGFVGQVLFPTAGGAPTVLREDVANPTFGTPRDLNGDGLADALDHSSDYQLLPVVVRMAWRTTKGTARLEFKTVLVDL